ncbi:MAG: type II toxin-antitoxin system prevent-host-death family antitoxin [Acidobacteria bacterium]|nr:type II toxin-antitoxin system prevent-host-death family antitoxin [Acidobacteriota bacterium]
MRLRIPASNPPLFHSQFQIYQGRELLKYQDIIKYYSGMKSVPINELKQRLASIIAEAEAGFDVQITKHNKPVARLTRPDTQNLHRGSQFGKAKLNSVLKRKTAGRYLQMLKEDRDSGAR